MRPVATRARVAGRGPEPPPRVVALDGVRGVAVVLVLFLHVGLLWRWPVPTPILENGGFGVDLFFVLSGFLITGLLLGEHRAAGRIGLRGFYLRRALRLLPPLAAVLVLHAFVALRSGEPIEQELRTIAAAATYTHNLVIAGGGTVAYGLDHLWSLSVEEQLYLAWPPLLVLAVRRRVRWSVLAGGLVALTVASALWRVHLFGVVPRDRWYHGTDSRLDAPLAGAALAVLRHASGERWEVLARHRAAVGVAGSAVLAVAFADAGAEVLGGWAHAVVTVGACGLVAAASCGWSAGGALTTPVATWLGARSYALYLWHVPVVAWMFRRGSFGPAVALRALAATAALAELSWWTVERWSRMVRSRLEVEAASPLGASGPPPDGHGAGARPGAAAPARRPLGRRAGVLVILGVAVVLRGAVLRATPAYAPATDSADYHRIASSLAAGRGFGPNGFLAVGGPSAFRPPLYPFALSLAYRVAGADPAVGRVLNVGLSLLAVGAVGLLARRFLGPRAGVAALALAAVLPSWLLMSATLEYEPMAVVLVVAALLCADRVRTAGGARLGWAAAAGAAVGLCALTRETVALVVLPALWLVVRRSGLRRALTAGGVLVAAAMVVVSPWAIRNHRAFGGGLRLTTGNGYALAGAYNGSVETQLLSPYHWSPPELDPIVRDVFADHAGASEPALDAALRRAAVDHIVEHPGLVPRVVGWNTLRLVELDGGHAALGVAPYLSYPPGLVGGATLGWWALALLAVWGVARRQVRSAVPTAVWCTPFLYAAAFVLVATSQRYRALIEPFAVLAAAGAIADLWPLLTPSRKPTWRSADPLAMVSTTSPRGGAAR